MREVAVTKVVETVRKFFGALDAENFQRLSSVIDALTEAPRQYIPPPHHRHLPF
jgi:hypothetical protein